MSMDKFANQATCSINKAVKLLWYTSRYFDERKLSDSDVYKTSRQNK